MASSRTRLWLVFVWCVGSAEGQVQDSVYYSRDHQDQDSYGNTYVYNNRRYGRPSYPGEGDYNRGYGENDGRYYDVSKKRGNLPTECCHGNEVGGILSITILQNVSLYEY
jgi:hypothetical protein